ncbi:uncharacterized protein LOC122364585 [Amphibalanus amphitrite]|uniref:uncharacterized protein LOC122364585 n=1 Tax=Amphibalanus amphitrite TaxID=1232801 RepID=UPI001C91B332|nr:uncharacterized protein LOC122364585 [Amphibalanus amphitrite]
MAGGERVPPPPAQAATRPAETPPSTGKPAEVSAQGAAKSGGKSTEQSAQGSGKSGKGSEPPAPASGKTSGKSEQPTQGSGKSGKGSEQTSHGSGKSTGKSGDHPSQGSGKPNGKTTESANSSGKSGSKSLDQSGPPNSSKSNSKSSEPSSGKANGGKAGDQPSPKPPDKASASSGDSKRLSSDRPPESPGRSPRRTKKSPTRGRDAVSLDTGDERKNGKKARKVSAVKGSSADSEPPPAAAPASAGSGEQQAVAGPEEDEGVQKVRALGRRTLALCQRSDWVAVEQSLKSVERAAQEANIDNPLADIADENGYTPLMYAAKDNRVMVVDKLIELGCNVNHMSEDGFSILHFAVLHAREDMVKTLLNRRADVNALTGPKKMTCVHLVCTRTAGLAVNILRLLLQTTTRDVRLVKDVSFATETYTLTAPIQDKFFHPGSSTLNQRTLLKALLDKDSDGNIPLFLAIEAGSQHLCRELLNYQPELQVKVRKSNKDSVLHLAVRRRDIDLARLFVDYGVQVDAQNKDGQTALHIAAAEGDDIMVKFFYSIHANPNIADHLDRTPLHIAAERGHALVVEILADKFKASVMDRTKDGSTLMHIASLNGHPEAVMAFLRKGVPLHMPNKAGARAIHTAALTGHAGVINALIQKGESVDVATRDNYTALHLAVQAGKAAVVETLLGHGAQVEIRGGALRETPLHIAARVQDGDKCAEMLLKSGASVQLTMENGQTPLHVAAQCGHLKTCQLLLEDGADPMAQSNNGENPLHLACQNSNYQVISLLRDFVAKQSSSESEGAARLKRLMNIRNELGETAVHYASRVTRDRLHYPQEDKDIIKLLCVNGGSLDLLTTKAKETPFHYVARHGNNAILEQMLIHLKDEVPNVQVVLNRQNSGGASCLMVASQQGHLEVTKNLLQHNVRVDVFDSDGKAALHLAAEQGHLEVCNALLAHKAFVNSRSKIGLTALHLAAMRGYKELVQTLIQKHNAAVDVNTLTKNTPLHLAAEAGQIEVCSALIQIRSDANATNDSGQKPIHLAAQNNHSEVVKLFLKHFPELVTTADRDGNTCAHIAAMKGSVDVIRELMKFNKQMVTSCHNKTSESTPLHMAAEGGHAEVVRVLIEAGASPTEETRYGFTPVHLAARAGHNGVLAQLRSQHSSMRITSRKNGLSALHVAAFYGEADIVRELLQHVPATLKSETPTAATSSFIRELGSESGLTPLHMAAYSGKENIVRLLMNSPGVQVDATTNLNAYIPLHLACVGGHTAVAGLLLSRSTDQLHCKDRRGRTGLHIASMNGHLAMVSQLLGQGADINAADRDGLTALHYSSKNGHLDVVKQLIESGASPKFETTNAKTAICFAVSNEHFDVIEYLLRKDHDSYALLSDKKFVSDLTMVSKKYDNKPLQDFILLSPAPVDVASKLSYILYHLSIKEKEKTKDLLAASHYCEVMATEILSLAAGSKSAGILLRALDYQQNEFLDILIELEQKEVIAHPAVQRYLTEVWRGHLDWPNWKTIGLFFAFLACPPVWVFFSLPIGHKYCKVPVIKFTSHLASHIFFIVLLILTVVTPLWPIWLSTSLVPHVPEWMVFTWLSGMLLSELTNPRDRAGLGMLRIVSLITGGLALGVHLVGFAFSSEHDRQDVLYIRNQLLAVAMLFACVQLLDFLTFHRLFGPWTVIIRALMVDLGRFLVIMSIFVLGFTLHVAAIYQPVRPMFTNGTDSGLGYPPNEAPVQTPLQTLEMMFFSIFGLVDTYDYLPPLNSHPAWSQTLIKFVFGSYMIVAVVVLINLLIAMMSDTYQRIQSKSDTEWKFGLAKLIRNTNRTSSAPAPLNLFTKLFIYIHAFIKFKGRLCDPRALEYMKTERLPKDEKKLDMTTNVGGNWMGKMRKKSVGPGLALPVTARTARRSTADFAIDMNHSNLSVQPSSASNITGPRRLENVIDWPKVVEKYLANTGQNTSLHKGGGLMDNDNAAEAETTDNGQV